MPGTTPPNTTRKSKLLRRLGRPTYRARVTGLVLDSRAVSKYSNGIPEPATRGEKPHVTEVPEAQKLSGGDHITIYCLPPPHYLPYRKGLQRR